jgi:ribosomal protein L7/L12
MRLSRRFSCPSYGAAAFYRARLRVSGQHVKTQTMETYTALLKDFLAGGAMLEDALAELRVAGATPLETIKAIRAAQSVSLGEAKEIFSHSSVWAAEVQAGDALHLEALALLDKQS